MPAFTMTLDEVIEFEGANNIGLDSYPIFDEAHRAILNQKIIDQYLNCEIGQETISMFRHAMRRKMNNIMPMYNEHYRLSAIKLDALSTMNVNTKGTSTGSSTGESGNSTENTTNGKSVGVASSFPQNRLRPDGDYATGSQESNSDTTSKSTAEETQNASQTGANESTMTGYQGHQPSLIFAARETIVNIDLDIISELKTLFMGIWNTNEEYSRGINYYG